MKKLDDIPKKHPFSVPDGYFDKMAMAIQNRVAKPVGKPVLWSIGVRYALPAMLILIAIVIYFKPEPQRSAEELLASVSTDALVEYLETSDLTTDELLEVIDVDDALADDIQQEVFSESDWLELDPTEIDFEEHNL